jgi:4-hydroxybenzoate polyprenyltransferase
MGNILYIVGAVLVALWLIGFLTNIGGGLIHLILVIAVVVFLFQFLSGRRRV